MNIVHQHFVFISILIEIVRHFSLRIIESEYDFVLKETESSKSHIVLDDDNDNSNDNDNDNHSQHENESIVSEIDELHYLLKLRDQLTIMDFPSSSGKKSANFVEIEDSVDILEWHILNAPND
jgi:hypothetical protein